MDTFTSLAVNTNECFQVLVDGEPQIQALGDKATVAIRTMSVFRDLLQYGAAALSYHYEEDAISFSHVDPLQTFVVAEIDALVATDVYFIGDIVATTSLVGGVYAYVTHEVISSHNGRHQWLKSIYSKGNFKQYISELTSIVEYAKILHKGGELQWSVVRDQSVQSGGEIPLLWFSSSLNSKPFGKSIIDDNVMDLITDFLYSISSWSDGVAISASPQLVEIDAVPLVTRDMSDPDKGVVASGPKAIMSYRSIGDTSQGKVFALTGSREMQAFDLYTNLVMKLIFMCTNIGVYELEKILASDSSAAVARMLHRTTGAINKFRVFISKTLVNFLRQKHANKVVEIKWYPVFDVSPTDAREWATAISSLIGNSPGQTLTSSSASAILTGALARDVDIEDVQTQKGDV